MITSAQYSFFLKNAQLAYAFLSSANSDKSLQRDYFFLEMGASFVKRLPFKEHELVGHSVSSMLTERRNGAEWFYQLCMEILNFDHQNDYCFVLNISNHEVKVCIQSLPDSLIAVTLSQPAELFEAESSAQPCASDAASRYSELIHDDASRVIASDNQLQQTRQTYLNIFNTLTEAIYILDDAGVFVEVNRGAEIMFGCEKAELIGKSPMTVAAPGKNDMEAVQKKLDDVRKSGKPERFEFWAVRKNGDVFPKEVIVSRGIYFGNEVLIATARDISEIKNATQMVIDSVLKFHNLIEQAVEGILIGSSEGIIIDANSRFCSMLGLRRDELCGQHISMLPFVLESVKNSPFRFDLLLKGETVISERQLNLPKGGVITVEMRTKMMPDKTYQSIFIDITTQKRGFDDLQKAHEKMKLASEAAHFGVWDYDLINNHHEWDEWMHKIYGTDASGGIPISFLHHNFIHPDDAEKVAREIQLALIDKRHYSNEFRIVKPNGDVRYIKSMALIVRDDNNMPLRTTGVNYDITETKLAEQRLREAETNQRVILENSLDSIWSVDTNCNILYINNIFQKSFQQIFGITLSKGVNILESLPEALRMTWKRRYDKVFDNQQLFFDDRIDLADSVVFIEVAMQPIVIDGTVIGASLYGRNITQQKLAEAALKSSETNLRTLIEALPDLVFFKDGDGRWLTVNSAALQVFHLIGKDYLNKTEMELATIVPELAQALEQCSRSDQKTWETGQLMRLEETLTDEKGNTFCFDTIKVPLFNSDGSRKGIVVVGRDITQRKLSDKKIRESEIRMRELNASKDKFFSIIAHDLRSPFSSIVGFAELIVEQINEKDFSELELYANQILKSSRKSLDLLTNLMTWARSQTGRLNFKPEPVQLRSAVEERIQLLSAAASQKSIKVVNFVDNGVWVVADSNMLATVLRNLITNAVKFTFNNGEIEITSMLDEGKVVVQVSDNGMGMDQDLLDNLFRLDVNTGRLGTNNEASTGLGLVLCRDFVEKHGGILWAESEPNTGSTFKFTLPVAEEHYITDDTQHSEIDQTILVADNDHMGFLVLKSMLQLSGIKALHCVSKSDTMLQLNENQNVLSVIFSINLPGADGFNFVRELRTLNETVPIIALSDELYSGGLKKALDAGCVDHLSKPLNREVLNDVVQKVMLLSQNQL